MRILEIMKSWGVNDSPNDVRHFEEEVAEYYQKDLKDALKLALGCLEQGEYFCQKPNHIIERCKKALNK